jgi:hypothetical protein
MDVIAGQLGNIFPVDGGSAMTTTDLQSPPGPVFRKDQASESSPRPHEPPEEQNDRFYTHQLTILSVSSGMVGVCLTAIGLIGILKSLNRVEVLVDDMLAVGAVLFMVTALLSFFAMRMRLARAWVGLAVTIDLVFCLGLVLVVVATAMLTWEVL